MFGWWTSSATCPFLPRPNSKVRRSFSFLFLSRTRFFFPSPSLFCWRSPLVLCSYRREDGKRHQTGRRLRADIHLQTPHADQIQPLGEGKGVSLVTHARFVVGTRTERLAWRLWRDVESAMRLQVHGMCPFSGSPGGRRGVPGLHAQRTARGDAGAQEARLSLRRQCVHFSLTLFIRPLLGVFLKKKQKNNRREKKVQETGKKNPKQQQHNFPVKSQTNQDKTFYVFITDWSFRPEVPHFLFGTSSLPVLGNTTYKDLT